MRTQRFILFILCLEWGGLWMHAEIPDMLVFLTDDLSLRDVSCYGSPDVRTPNMDRLAAAGMRFDLAFVASPACAPSRAALLTGLMPARNGAESNHTYPHAPYYPGFIGLFQKMGYEVVSFGKISHGRLEHKQRWNWDHLERHYDAETVRAFLESRDPAQPLLLMVGTPDPHVPWTEDISGVGEALVLPPFLVDTEETRQYRRQYYADVMKADAAFGAIYDLFLEYSGEASPVLFSSDHGAQWPGGKWTLYDEGTRVPLMIAWPGRIEPGSVSEAMVSWVDLLPTLLDLAGGELPSEIDGNSFAEVLEGERAHHRDEVFTTHTGDSNRNLSPMRAVRTERFKYIRNFYPQHLYTTHIDHLRKVNAGAYWTSWEEAAREDPAAASLVLRYYLKPAEEFYDLEKDPEELNNLAGDPRYRVHIHRMREQLGAWMVEQGDTLRVVSDFHRIEDRQSLLDELQAVAEE